MRLTARVLLVSGILVLPGIGLAVADETDEGPCPRGRFIGKEVTGRDLASVLAEHKVWLATDSLGGYRADFCGAVLDLADLRSVDLRSANLGYAHLVDADLRHAALSQADLEGADLRTGWLGGADFTDARLAFANLRGVRLYKVNLRGSNLRAADLTKVDFSHAELRDADLAHAWVHGAVFEPSSIPAAGGMGQARGIEAMVYKEDPTALQLLREEFKRAGLRDQERRVTYAIQRTHRERLLKAGGAGAVEGAFHLIAFEWPSNYGLTPWRPLLALAISIVALAVVYVAAILHPGKAGLWIVWASDRIEKAEGSEHPTQLTSSFSFDGSFLGGGDRRFHVRGLRVLRLALHFSVLTAFQLGWRELAIGTWITRLQVKEYTIRPTGWVRPVAGFQSLMSLYLLVLWVLTYWGRPFE